MVELEAKFVGRDRYLEDICSKICCSCSGVFGKSQQGIRIVGLYGQAGVGKTRLANRCIEIITNKIKTESKSISINLRGIKSQSGFIENVSLALGFNIRNDGQNHDDFSQTDHIFDPEMNMFSKLVLDVDRWQHKLKKYLQCYSGHHLLVLFDNAEDMALDDGLQNTFLEICSGMAVSSNATVFITSRIRYCFARLYGVYKDVSVRPMNEEESLQLFKQETVVELGDHASELVTFCAGIPFAIILTASELNGNDGMLTPEDMVELLKESRLNSLSPEAYAQDEHMNHIVEGAISRMREKLRDIFAQINFIPGTFGADAAGAVIGSQSTAQAKKNALIPLNRHSMVSFDGNDGRFDIHPFLREWIEMNLEIKELPVVRERYTHYFGTILQELQESLDSPDSKKRQTLLPSISTEKLNLQKLLQEAIHCSDDTFRVYMKLATVAKPIIENYMAADAIKFFKDLYEASEVFGDEMDQGVALGNVGLVIADHEGNRDGAKKKYEQARILLECHGDSQPLAGLYCSMAWNEMFLGNYVEAIRLARCACEMRARLGTEEDLKAATMFNVLGVVLMNSGKPEDALQYLIKALDLRLKLLPEEHISVATQYNNLGHCYGKIGDMKKALELKKKSLLLKERVKASTKTIVISIISVSDEFKRNGELVEAEALLKRGLEIHRKEPLNPGDEAGMLTHLGDVYILMGRDADACEAYCKAVNIAEKNEQKRVYVKYMVQFGKVLLVAGNLKEAKQTLRKAVDMRDVMREYESDVFESLNTLIQVHLAGEERVLAHQCCQEAFGELTKLYAYYLTKRDRGFVGKMVSKMSEFYTSWRLFFPHLKLDLPVEISTVLKCCDESDHFNAKFGKYPTPEPIDRHHLIIWKRSLAYPNYTYYPKPKKLDSTVASENRKGNDLIFSANKDNKHDKICKVKENVFPVDTILAESRNSGGEGTDLISGPSAMKLQENCNQPERECHDPLLKYEGGLSEPNLSHKRRLYEEKPQNLHQKTCMFPPENYNICSGQILPANDQWNTYGQSCLRGLSLDSFCDPEPNKVDRNPSRECKIPVDEIINTESDLHCDDHVHRLQGKQNQCELREKEGREISQQFASQLLLCTNHENVTQSGSKVPVQSDDFSSYSGPGYQNGALIEQPPAHSLSEYEDSLLKSHSIGDSSQSNKLSEPSSALSMSLNIPQDHAKLGKISDMNIPACTGIDSIEENTSADADSSLHSTYLQRLCHYYCNNFKGKGNPKQSSEPSELSEDIPNCPSHKDYAQQMPSLKPEYKSNKVKSEQELRHFHSLEVVGNHPETGGSINETAPKIPVAPCQLPLSQGAFPGIVNFPVNTENCLHQQVADPVCQVSQVAPHVRHLNPLPSHKASVHGCYNDYHTLVPNVVPQPYPVPMGISSSSATPVPPILVPNMPQVQQPYVSPHFAQYPCHAWPYQEMPCMQHQRNQSNYMYHHEPLHAGHAMQGNQHVLYTPHTQLPRVPYNQTCITSNVGVPNPANVCSSQCIVGSGYDQSSRGLTNTGATQRLPSMTTLSRELANVHIYYPPDVNHQ